jgi:hypothetical protein
MSANAFLQTQVTALETQINAYNAAIAAVLSGGVESYRLNTGQTDQMVTKLNVDKLQTTVTSLYNQYTTLCARLTGSGVLIARPAW